MKPVFGRRFPLFIFLIFVCLLTLSLNGSLLAQPSNQIDEPLTSEGDLLQPVTGNQALQFNGRDQYVTLGPAPHLGADAFTLELWFRWDGGGITTNTGVDGVEAYPLLTKGRPEGDNSVTDMNYFLGIRGSDKVLVADLEEGAGGATPGQNHPITGVTPVVEGEWTHAAAAYDGRQWQLFLNGKLQAEIVVEQPVRSDSIQHAALATALNSKGVPAGYFAGALDEVRIWDKALNEQEIRANINAELSDPQPHLLARWGMDDALGAVMVDSVAGSGTDVATASSNTRVPGAPFTMVVNDEPAAPVLVKPADSAVNVATAPTLEVTVSDPEADNMTVTFYGRPLTTSNSDFTLVAMPDTQKYAQRFSPIFAAQTQWVVDNKDALNIAHVMQLGDCVENGDEVDEWEFADAAFSLIEDSSTTGLDDGIPYSITVGNHDQTPFGDPDGDSTALYNQYFGSARFSGRDYYGGYYGSNFDNHYELFSAGGMDFIIISLEFDGASPAVLTWADNVLNTYSSRQAIVISHYLINTGIPGRWGGQGEDIYDALKERPNLFLMHSGHKSGEGQRVDTHDGNIVHTLVADYQSRKPDGGNGWLRIMEFSPNNNEIRVKTYSPTLNEYETDTDSQFTLDYEMQGAVDFVEIGQVSGVASGANASVPWSGLEKSTEYEWYVTMDDGSSTTTGLTWSFTTGSQQLPEAAFSGSPLAGPAPLNVDFSNLTTGDYETCTWDFGDGGSTECNDPAHSYSTPGTYSVALSVDGPLGPSSSTKNDYITVYNPAVANFTPASTEGIAPETITFNNNSTGAFDTCSWDFGDGGSSHNCANQVAHTYNKGGTYTVSLTVNGNGGTDTEIQTSLIRIYEAPTAGFSGSATSGPAPLTVNFSNLTTGDYETCSWEFDYSAGSSVSSQCNDPLHTYNTPGTYSVNLSVNGAWGNDAHTKTDYIHVSAPAVAAFSGTPTSGTAPRSVSFSNESGGDYASCQWDFGDGGSSGSCATKVNYTYTTGGVFPVSLTINGSGGESTETKPGYITIYEAPTADFSASPTVGPASLLVQFTNSSSGDYDTCTWSFGDGGGSGDCNNPSHTYANPGTYEVRLTVNGAGGEATTAKTNYIVSAVPVTADFRGGPTGGIAPLPVSFSNLSTGDYDSCLWEFGDSSTSTDCSDPQHIYSVPGKYAVSLKVIGNGGSQTIARPNYIMVNEAGNANFSADPGQGTAPLVSQFTNLSLGDFNTCQWDFGDGDTSQECNNPAHTYTTPGIYTVSLAIDGSGGPDSVTFTDLIAVYEPVTADFSGDPLKGTGPFTANFTNLSSGDYLTCLWDFGDGSSLSQCDNPSHFYAEQGTYAVSLTVAGPGGSDTRTIASYVTVTGTVSFSAIPTSGQVPLMVTFNNLSRGLYKSCLWKFGDGVTSSDCANPSHIYTASGTYTVELMLTGRSSSNSAIKVDYIAAEPRLMILPLILRSSG